MRRWCCGCKAANTEKLCRAFFLSRQYFPFLAIHHHATPKMHFSKKVGKCAQQGNALCLITQTMVVKKIKGNMQPRFQDKNRPIIFTSLLTRGAASTLIDLRMSVTYPRGTGFVHFIPFLSQLRNKGGWIDLIILCIFEWTSPCCGIDCLKKVII